MAQRLWGHVCLPMNGQNVTISSMPCAAKQSKAIYRGFTLRCACVCPEPVLAKRSSVPTTKRTEARRHGGRCSAPHHATEFVNHRLGLGPALLLQLPVTCRLRSNGLFPLNEFSLCLSRACLGYNDRFLHQESNRRRRFSFLSLTHVVPVEPVDDNHRDWQPPLHVLAGHVQHLRLVAVPVLALDEAGDLQKSVFC
jgi:hypothetical protein